MFHSVPRKQTYLLECTVLRINPCSSNVNECKKHGKDVKNAYKILVRESEGRGIFDDPGVWECRV
jgi:hypothetical protein